MKTFISVAQMKLAFLTAGQLVETSGYYAAGDGGQARYLVKASESVDNVGNHDLAGTTVAILQSIGSLNVKQFGAKGDGVTNDTVSFDSAWTASNPAPVFVPVASYEIPGTVTGSFYSFGLVTIVTGTVNTILNASGSASITAQGAVELATQTEVNARADAVRAITPATMLAPIIKVKTADSILLDDILANDTHLSGFNLEIDTYYKVTAYLVVAASAAGADLKTDFVFDQSVQRDAMTLYAVDAATADTLDEVTQTGLVNTIITDIDGVNDVGIYIVGHVRTNESVATVCDLQVAQGTDFGSTTLREGSWVSFEKINP